MDPLSGGTRGSERGGWKPHMMRPPVMVSVIALSLVLGGVIEFLAQKSQRQGALALSKTEDDIPGAVTFGYLYAPTIISVIYSLVWAGIDLDIRRMQPWLELSRPHGATADSSLLLDYPSTFLAFVPFSAWKQKHWPVFFSGITTMILFWGVTPLQSTVFDVKPVNITSQVTMRPSIGLVSPQEQAIKMDTSVLTAAYGVTWLDQAFPRFTTPDYAIIPFSPIEKPSTPSSDESWFSTATMLTTELTCKPPSARGTPDYMPNTHWFQNDQGCNTSVGFFHINPLKNESSAVLYIGWYGSAILDYSMRSPTCDGNSSNQFLAIWAHQGIAKYTNVTALFCEPLYYKQNVSVEISAVTGRPVENSAVPLGPKELLGPDEFNSTALEYLLGVGEPEPTATRDFPAQGTIEPFASLVEKDVAWPVTNTVNVALGLLKGPTSELQNATLLAQAFNKAHKVIFSAAVSQLISSANNTRDEVGTIRQTLHGVVVSRTMSIVLEALLLAVVVFMALVFYTCTMAPSKLTGDPKTIAFTLGAIRTSPSVLDRFSTEDRADAATLGRNLGGERFTLKRQATGNILEMDTQSSSSSFPTPSRNNAGLQDVKFQPAQPVELSPSMGFVIIIVMLFGTGLLIYLKEQEKILGGLPLPSSNFEVQQLLENYLPTVFSTVLELVLVLLTRLLCTLQPFNELRLGGCSSAKAFENKYTSLPPQLAVWRALKARHFLLGALCVISLLANILTVALSGAFNQSDVEVEHPMEFLNTRTANLTRDTIRNMKHTALITPRDHFYTTWSNMSTNTPLPPWVTAEYAFLPIDIKESSNQTVAAVKDAKTIFRAQTRGFGAKSTCKPLSSTPSTTQSYANVSYATQDNVAGEITVLFRRPNGTLTECFFRAHTTGLGPVGRSAREIATSMRAFRGNGGGSVPGDDFFCDDHVVLGWLRADPGVAPNKTLQSSFIQCESVLRTGIFDVTFDRAGRVLSYYPSSSQPGEADDTTKFMTLNVSRTLMREASTLITHTGRSTMHYEAWHNATVATDWYHYLLKYHPLLLINNNNSSSTSSSTTNGTGLVDPVRDVPRPEAVIPAVEDLYRRIFAALLGQNIGLFQPLSSQVVVNGVAIKTETRIFIHDAAYAVSVGILCLNIIVLAIMYWKQRHPYLPRMPSTIGSLIAYVAASRAVREYRDEDAGDSSSGGETEGEERGWLKSRLPKHLRPTYSFGRYVGVDGNWHVGIEVDPLVVPVDETMLERKGTWGSMSSLRFRGKA